jgi:site-specific DNA-methyltransferase (adenine-specific)
VRPYYDHQGITIFHGDCREILPTLHAVLIDAIVADPPYGDTSLDWDVRDLTWLDLSERLLARSGSAWCFGSMRMFMAQAADLSRCWHVMQDLVWEKHNGSSFHADRFKRVHEHAVHLVRKGAAWSEIYKAPVTTPDATARRVHRKRRPAHLGAVGNGFFESVEGGPRLMRSVIFARSCHGMAEHPTQKPVEVVRPLVLYSCPPRGRVLDPTMGSGTTLVVARELGRQAIGIEIDERYCEVAARRLSQQPLGLVAP